MDRPDVFEGIVRESGGATRGVIGWIFSGSSVSRLFGRVGLITADACALVASLSIAVLVVEGGAAFEDVVFLTPLLLAGWFAVLSAHNLYSWTPPQRRDVGGLVSGLLWGVGLLGLGPLLYPESGFVLVEVAVAGSLVVSLCLGTHFVYGRSVEYIYSRGLGRIPTLVVGPEQERERVRRMLEGGGAYVYVGGMDLDHEGAGSLARLRRMLDVSRARSVVLTESASGHEGFRFAELLRSMWLRKVRVMMIPTTSALVNNALVPNKVGATLLEVRYPRPKGLQWSIKRTLDVVVASGLLVLLLPVFLLITLVIRFNSRGPALFRQRRAGADQLSFICYKFRSMYVDAGTLQAELERLNDAEGAFFKIKRDPRVTAPGQFLRRWSLDELPQLVNVLRGDMSLVGPRPLPIRDFEQMSDYEKRRLLTVPGITGLWQVSGRSDLPFDEMMRLDLHYIENWSLALDLGILLRTFRAVLRGRGAY
ncbi:exopolysaccharide biosynthesis polyprenyl glycosylphosphotransferase [Rubrobacter indicoceani]|uniref:exopolysaccharide biosynthesis polyprenyl glycosylphosphotransferase n=1 Tax=Rubrobacter indicoceani TaxID=2051957 RepID=UPI000E5C51A7|nr:exopolysaccharide biosynthesis polyprenyl glycosylphosphotransferase [Rubrobacter indicoceani]